MSVQWWIDTVGKLGPGIVAVLVLFTTRRQNRWQNAIAVRAGRVEDQKFRLALLERRNDAIDKVRFAVSQFWSDGVVRQDATSSVAEALRIADLVFDDAERSAIEKLLKFIWAWQSLNRRLNSYRDSPRPDAERLYRETEDKLQAAETVLIEAFEPLLIQLKEAARVKSVPSIRDRPSVIADIKRLVGR